MSERPMPLPVLDVYPDGSAQEQREAIDLEGTTAFDEKHSHLNISPRSARHLLDFCHVRNCPTTLWNLEVALSRTQLDSPPESSEGTFDNPIYTELPQDPYDKGITRLGSQDTIKLRYLLGSPAQRELAGERPERFEELLGDVLVEHQNHVRNVESLSPNPGHPVSKELRQAATASRLMAAKINSIPPNVWEQARAQVFLEHEAEIDAGKLRRDSHEFNKLVAQKISGE